MLPSLPKSTLGTSRLVAVALQSVPRDTAAGHRHRQGSMPFHAHHTLLSTCAFTLEDCFSFSFSCAIVDLCCECLFAQVDDCASCGLGPINLDVHLFAT